MIFDVPLAKENATVFKERDGLLGNFSVARNPLPLSAKPWKAYACQPIPHNHGC